MESDRLLDDVLSKDQIKHCKKLLNEYKLGELRKYINDMRPALEEAGINPDYLLRFYVLQYFMQNKVI